MNMPDELEDKLEELLRKIDAAEEAEKLREENRQLKRDWDKLQNEKYGLEQQIRSAQHPHFLKRAASFVGEKISDFFKCSYRA